MAVAVVAVVVVYMLVVAAVKSTSRTEHCIENKASLSIACMLMYMQILEEKPYEAKDNRLYI